MIIIINKLVIMTRLVTPWPSITREDIENFRLGQAVDEISDYDPFSSGLGGGDLLTAGPEGSDEDEPEIFRGLKPAKSSFSSLSSTSNSIMNMIFNLGGMSNGIPTPPPMPIATTKAVAAWATWGAWTPCPVTCGGGSRKRYRTCKRTSSSQSCTGSHRQVGFCNTKPCGM